MLIQNIPVPEIDVIIKVALWLNSNGYATKSVSIPKGSGIENSADKQKLIDKLSAAGISTNSISFQSEGPDIVASFNEGYWKIECKGLGGGKVSTLRTNFDRALASVVSYYDSKTGIRLGLAIPKEDTYFNLIASKIPQPLREALDLWIFFINADSVEVIEPKTQIPSKRKSIEEAEWV